MSVTLTKLMVGASPSLFASSIRRGVSRSPISSSLRLGGGKSSCCAFVAAPHKPASRDTSKDNMVLQDIIDKNHFHCYLLRSCDPDHPLKTYIGYTTHPQRRIRQHNGELTSGGARRTRRNRPWEYVAIIDGFHDKISAMQFEWAWQHVHRSIVFRNAVGCDKLARRMKRRRGIKPRLEEMAILMNGCTPFHTLPLKVYFLEEEHHDLFSSVYEGKDYGLNIDMEKIGSLDDIPFAKRKSTGTVEEIPSLTKGKSFEVTSMGIGNVWSTIGFGKSKKSNRFDFVSNTYNPLLRLGLRSKATWALNAVIDANVVGETTQNDEQVTVKVPAKFKPYPFPYHQELTVKIESLTNLGFGIARVEVDNLDENRSTTNVEDAKNDDDDDAEKKKWVIFIPNVIPGETVRIRVYRNYASYSDADLMEILEASPDRIEPKCSLATICGGCQYQHITIERQRQMKTIQVQELFERLGGVDGNDFPAVLDTLGTSEVFGYRSKITPHYDAPMKKKGGRKAQPILDEASKKCEIGPIGFKEKASRRLVDVPQCHIATPAINEALVQLREDKREEARQGLLKKPTKGATLLLRDSDGVVETDHNVYVNTTVKDLTFRFQAGNFFQNNPFMLPFLVDLVVDAATKESSRGEKMTHLIDCYCGSGLFAIGSSSSFDVCVGIEVNEKAIEEARENAAINGIHNCDFVSASAEAIFQSKDPVKVGLDNNDGEVLLVRDFPRSSTVVVCDPPRKGCSEEFLEQLNEYKPARVVYMSCDPATQARDSKFLVSYGYKIVSVQPFDLFPQTRHIECLAVFEKNTLG